MKQFRHLVLALAAVVLAAGFTACSSDDDTTSNIEKYQQIVDKTVKASKKNNKAILLVAFGSTWQKAFNTFDSTLAAYKAEFPDYDVYMSFSSVICINRAAAGEHADEGAEIRNYYAPSYWLEAFGRVQYEEIIVQSLQVTPGEEYGRVVNYTKDFLNNSYRDLDEDYLEEVRLSIGVPLMQDAETDVNALADAIHTNLGSYAAKGVVALMGHGNPNEYDTYSANIRYTQLVVALHLPSPNYYVGTVDMEDNFKVQVLERMQEAGITSGIVYCHPLMSIAGDHAHNDLAGDDGEDEDDLTPNDEGEVEDMSWKVYFAKNGYDCTDDYMILEGLLDYDNIRQLWINHTYNAIEELDEED